MVGHVLDVCDLSVARSGKIVIKDVCLTVDEGEFLGIVGPNGSGKSTFMLAVLGLLKSNSGTIRIYGHPPMSGMIRQKIGWVSQAASHLPGNVRLTVGELVNLGTLHAGNLFHIGSQSRRYRTSQAIRMTGLEHVQNVDIGKLSGGQRQRAVIARALATEADLILLDEPLVGIDRESRNSLLKLLDRLCHEEGKTIIMVSHDLTAIRQTAHRMVFLEETIRFDGPTRDFPNLERLASLRGIEHVHDIQDN
ncbi:MAG: metal ABC transporter ATP-binding protein [Candidatus Poseidoniales archaeon]